jgi:hypothetical protein
MTQRGDHPNPPTRTGGGYQSAGLRAGVRRQFFEAQFKTIVNFAGSEGDTGGQFQIRVPTPSSQVRVLISVNFEPAAGQPDDLDLTGVGNTIWLAATDDAVGGASSQDIPNSSVEGMRSAPTPFPFTVVGGVITPDNGLLGYAREFVTASPWITGIVNIGVGEGAPAPGAWVLRARYQPDGVVLPDDAWEEIISMVGALQAFKIA